MRIINIYEHHLCESKYTSIVCDNLVKLHKKNPHHWTGIDISYVGKKTFKIIFKILNQRDNNTLNYAMTK